MDSHVDYLIIGAGIIGLATAWRLRECRPDARILVVDKEATVAAHQSGHNSGVIHAGVYYPPDSLKARFCRDGVAATLAFCTQHGVAARQCGKLIVAVDEAETVRLRALATRAADNGLDCSWLDGAAISEREPLIRGVAALHVPTTGIADYPALCNTLASLLREHGVAITLSAPVIAIVEGAQQVAVSTPADTVYAKRVIVCAGLQADRMALLGGLRHDYTVVPFRGDYYELPVARGALVSSLIYPVPDPALPFLGVHLTLDTGGRLTIGPSAMLAFAREAYRKWAFDRADAVAALGFSGTWRLLAKFPRAGLRELAYALSRRYYLRAAQRYCPSLVLDDLAVHRCGVRAQLVNRQGELVNDFVLEETARSLHVLNAPSPAATSAFPIAAAIVERVLGKTTRAG